MRKALTILSLFFILVCGVFSVGYAYEHLGETYDGSKVDVIVKENLEKTMAANNVAAVVFDFRGFDTIGESFILLTAIAGTYVILNGYRKPKHEEEKKDGGEE